MQIGVDRVKCSHQFFDTVISENDNVIGLKIDVDKHQNIASHFGVKSLPTILIFDKIELSRKSGSMTKQSLVNLIDSFTGI